MRAQMLELMRLMEGTIQADEMMAEGLMDDAERMQAGGQPNIADAFRTLARNYRVKVLELQARLAVVRLDYFLRFHEEPEAGA